jgi:DNA-binding XRE family transcriptional regulator
MPRQTTSPADYPQAVLQQIEQLAQNIVIARKRRGESQAQWAKKLGISQPTMARIERGDPSVAMASYVMCMWLINQAGGLAELIAPQHDHVALEKEVAKVKTKRRQKKQERSHVLPRNLEPPASITSDHAWIDPTADFQKSLIWATKASDLARLGLDPTAEILQSLKSSTKASDHLVSPNTAAGLAALLAKSDPKKK